MQLQSKTHKTISVQKSIVSLDADRSCDAYQMKALPRTFIHFACEPSQTASENLFIKHLLGNLSRQHMDIRDVFQYISDKVYQESNGRQRPLSISDLSGVGETFLNPIDFGTYRMKMNYFSSLFFSHR